MLISVGTFGECVCMCDFVTFVYEMATHGLKRSRAHLEDAHMDGSVAWRWVVELYLRLLDRQFGW